MTKNTAGVLPANGRYVSARLPGAYGVANGRSLLRAAFRPCSGRSFVGPKMFAADKDYRCGAVCRLPATRCLVVTGYRTITIRAGGVSEGEHSRRDGANRAGGDATWRTAPVAHANRASAYERHHGGTSHSRVSTCGRHRLGAFSAAFPVRTLQLACLLRGGENQRAHFDPGAVAVISRLLKKPSSPRRTPGSRILE